MDDPEPLSVLDEAHKYLTNSDASRFNNSLANPIRQQRHLGCRILISTQEPTVVPNSILDLLSFIVCHRFSSPSWISHMERHVATKNGQGWGDVVLRLQTGEGVLFSPATLVRGQEDSLRMLGTGYLHVRTRPRVTMDGGLSVMATQTTTAETKAKKASPVPCTRRPSAKSGSTPTAQTNTKKAKPEPETMTVSSTISSSKSASVKVEIDSVSIGSPPLKRQLTQTP